MSVQELQACIEEVSADIERQKEVLKKLEKSKSALQRQLNDVRDPMARLPLEISSAILTLCLPSLPRPSALLAPLLFLNVCNAWTDIAVSTRALWAAIHIEFPRADGFSEFLGTWLTRARNHPLSISLHGTFDDDIDDGIATVIQQHTEHLKALEIFSDNGNALILPTRLAPFPSLETFTLGSLPDVDGEHATFTGREILDFLCLTPNLVECMFDNISISDWNGVPPGLILPSLRHLRFGKVEGEYSNAANIIRYLSLPALELLYLPIFTTDIPYFDLFLRRSSPPLRKLTMASYVWTSGFPQQMVACLCLASSITHFELYSANGMDVAPSLFAALSDTSSFLPTLRSLKLRRFQSRLSDDSYDALFRVLSFRRGQIVCFELRWSAYSNNVSEPNARLLAAFRQLIAEGMEIQIGTEFLNFI